MPPHRQGLPAAGDGLPHLLRQLEGGVVRGEEDVQLAEHGQGLPPSGRRLRHHSSALRLRCGLRKLQADWSLGKKARCCCQHLRCGLRNLQAG